MRRMIFVNTFAKIVIQNLPPPLILVGPPLTPVPNIFGSAFFDICRFAPMGFLFFHTLRRSVRSAFKIAFFLIFFALFAVKTCFPYSIVFVFNTNFAIAHPYFKIEV